MLWLVTIVFLSLWTNTCAIGLKFGSQVGGNTMNVFVEFHNLFRHYRDIASPLWPTTESFLYPQQKKIGSYLISAKFSTWYACPCLCIQSGVVYEGSWWVGDRTQLGSDTIPLKFSPVAPSSSWVVLDTCQAGSWGMPTCARWDWDQMTDQASREAFLHSQSSQMTPKRFGNRYVCLGSLSCWKLNSSFTMPHSSTDICKSSLRIWA